MTILTLRRALCLSLAPLAFAAAPPAALAQTAPATMNADGVLTLTSPLDVDAAVERITADVTAKGIRLFAVIDQAELGAGANIPIPASKLVLFGNPPLGVQFLSANPLAGLDWPVRMLVTARPGGGATVAWTDFGFIQRRYALKDRDAQIKMASDVAASIASSTLN